MTSKAVQGTGMHIAVFHCHAIKNKNQNRSINKGGLISAVSRVRSLILPEDAGSFSRGALRDDTKNGCVADYW